MFGINLDRLQYKIFGNEKACQLRGMHEVKYFYLSPDQKYITIQTKNGIYNALAKIEDLEFIEATGFKDINGKLIYSGDIVKINADLYEDLYLEFKDEYAVINYDESRACWIFAYRPRDNSGANIFNLICDYYYFLKWPPTGEIPYNTLAYVEVIGNIYENKELIKDNRHGNLEH